MNIEELAKAFQAARDKAANLDPLESDWDAAIATQLKIADELRALIFQDFLVKTSDPCVSKILRGVDLGASDDEYKTGFELLLDVVRPEEYLATLAEIKLFIPVGTQIPQHFRSFLEEARQCYALGRFTAVQCLCRAILEIAVNEVGVLNGEWTEKQLSAETFRRAYTTKVRMRMVLPNSWEKLYGLYKSLCEVVHGHEFSKDLEAFAKSIDFVERLYGSRQTKPE